MIQDSGDRTVFESGAVRDMNSEKGRCDLLPLGVIKELVLEDLAAQDSLRSAIDSLFRLLEIVASPDEVNVTRSSAAIEAIRQFADYNAWTMDELILEVSIHYKEGAAKYGDRNWEKGIPLWSFVDSAIRHFIKCLYDYNDERHDRAFVWNLLGFVYTIEKSDKFLASSSKLDTAASWLSNEKNTDKE